MVAEVHTTEMFCPLPKDLVYRGLAIPLSHILELRARSAFAVQEVLILYEYQQSVVRNITAKSFYRQLAWYMLQF